MKIAILLTATVRPQVFGSNFSVPQRMEMYRSTLAFYAKTLGRKYPVVIVENSDVDISSWQQEFKDALQLEVLQFTPPPIGWQQGAGRLRVRQPQGKGIQ